MSAAAMMEGIAEASPRFKARLAGALYLLSVLTAAFTELFVRGRRLLRFCRAASHPDAIVCDAGYPKTCPQGGDAWRLSLLRRSGTGHWRRKVRAGLSRNSESASVPRRRPWMSTRRHGSCSGAPSEYLSTLG